MRAGSHRVIDIDPIHLSRPDVDLLTVDAEDQIVVILLRGNLDSKSDISNLAVVRECQDGAFIVAYKTSLSAE